MRGVGILWLSIVPFLILGISLIPASFSYVSVLALLKNLLVMGLSFAVVACAMMQSKLALPLAVLTVTLWVGWFLWISFENYRLYGHQPFWFLTVLPLLTGLLMILPILIRWLNGQLG